MNTFTPVDPKSTSVILDREQNLIIVMKGNGEIAEQLDADKHIPKDCTRPSCFCSSMIDSFFRTMVMKYCPTGHRVNYIGDEAVITMN